MNAVKKIGLVLSVILLPLLISFLIISWGLLRTIGDESYVKNTVSNSGLYEEVSQIIIKQSTQDAPKDQIVAKSIKKAVSSKNVRLITEPAISAVYGWLDGNNSELTVELNINKIKKQFVSNYEKNLRKYLSALPYCTTYQDFNNLNLSEIKCLPAGVSRSQLVEEAVDKALANNDVFSDEVVSDGRISSKDAEEEGISTPVNPDLPTEIPSVYRFVKKSWPYTLLASVAVIAGIVFLSSSKLKGMKKIGVIFLTSSIGLILAGYLIRAMASSFLPATDTSNGQVPVESIKNIILSIFHDLSNLWLWSGIALLVVGITLIIFVVTQLKNSKPTN